MFDVGSFDPFLIDCCLCFVIVAVEKRRYKGFFHLVEPTAEPALVWKRRVSQETQGGVVFQLRDL